MNPLVLLALGFGVYKFFSKPIPPPSKPVVDAGAPAFDFSNMPAASTTALNGTPLNASMGNMLLFSDEYNTEEFEKGNQAFEY